MRALIQLLHRHAQSLPGRAKACARKRAVTGGGATDHEALAADALALFAALVPDASGEAGGGAPEPEALAFELASRRWPGQSAQGQGGPEAMLELFGLCRELCLDLVEDGDLSPTARRKALRSATRFFDRLCAAASRGWTRGDATADLAELRGRLRETAALNRLSQVLGREVASEAELMRDVAAALPEFWDAPLGLSARMLFDGAHYGGEGGNRGCSAFLEEPLTVLGQVRGHIRLCSARAEHAFQPGDRPLLAAVARQLERTLEGRLATNLLRRSERQFREFFDGAADAIFIHDEMGRVLDANRNASLWLNLSRGELRGANLLEHLAHGDRQAVAGRFQNALRGEPELFQATLVRRDGFAIPVELLCQAQEYQGGPGLITTGRNIAGRLRTQREIERRLEAEALVSAISGRLINSGGTGMAQAVEESLGDLCRHLNMTRAGVFLLEPAGRALRLAFQRRGHGLEPLPEALRRLSRGRAPWLWERIDALEAAVINNARHMPPAAAREKALLSAAGVASMTAVPMVAEGRLLGLLLVADAKPAGGSRLPGRRELEQAALLFAIAIERQRADAALRHSESLSRAILDALPANLCVLDRKGRLTMVNKAWGVTGPESTPLGGNGQRLDLGGNYLEACRAAAHNPHAAQALEGIAAVLARRAPAFRMEYPGNWRGEQRWFVLQASPLARGAAGAVVSHRDITGRMRAIMELKESEERFRIIVETAQEAVVMIDAGQTVTYANPRAASLFGHPAKRLIGSPLSTILDPADARLLEQKLKRRRQGLSDQYELRFRHRDGRRIWTMLNASPLRGPDGGYAGSIGMITDISDRVRAEARLRRNETRYRTLVESMHEGLVMARRSGVATYVNDSFCAMLGRRRADLMGRPLAQFAAPADQRRLEAMFGTGAGRDRREEIIWEHADGRHIYTLVSPTAYADEDGREAGFFAVVTDTTERKSLESQLLHSQKLEAIGQLAAGIAHEINTPAQYVGNNVQFIKGALQDLLAVVHGVRGFLEGAKSVCPGPEDIKTLETLLVERDVDYLAEEIPGALAQTQEGVERISTIVRSVKQFAHPGASAMAPADLNESMKSTATVSRNEWKYVAELDLDLDPALPYVVCMIGEINQVVLNLIINAAHAIADAKKTDPERQGRITLSTRLAPPWAEIRVTDTGTGIPAEVQRKIYDPFFTTKEVGRGTGQGLTISRSIVAEKHKGQLLFETRPGEGTTFVVRLPLAQASG